MTSLIRVYQCRLCLKCTPTRVNIYGGDFPKMLEVLTSIKAQENDGLPRYSCFECAQEVKTALLVKKRILKAHETLLECLKNKQKLFQRKAAEIGAVEITVRDQERIPNIVQKSFEETQELIEFVNIVKEEIEIKQEELIDSTNYPSIDRMEEKSFACQICNLKFFDKSSYRLHNAKHKKTKCHICSRMVKSDNIKKHVMLHTAGPSVCQLCGATCKNFESLRGHTSYHHKSSAKQYVCEKCGQGFRFKNRFLLHKKKVHMDLINFKCETCGKEFLTNGNLMTHVKMMHEKLRLHVCEFCGNGFSSKYTLKTHKWQHTGEKPYVCDFCQEGFLYRVSLGSHLRGKHGVKESKGFVFKTCSEEFATKYTLSVDERHHMSEKCEVCSETFSGEYLKKHLKEVHNINKDNGTEDELNSEHSHLLSNEGKIVDF